MDPNTITLNGASSYYTAWKQKFVDLIRAKFDAKIEYHANNLSIIGDEHAIDLKMDHNDSDVHIQIATTHNHRSWMFPSLFILLLMSFFLFFGGWVVWILGMYWIILFAFLIFGIGFFREEPDVHGRIRTIAENVWHTLYEQRGDNSKPGLRFVVSGSAPAKLRTHQIYTKIPGLVRNIYRLPDEAYLLSPEATKIAATPAVPVKGHNSSEMLLALYCPYCGTRRRPEANFCENCGSALAI